MDLIQLRYFLIASKSKNFTMAARAAYTSRQNLARSIRKLEQELGAPLFSRTGSTIELTYSGEMLLPKATAILDMVDNIEDSFRTENVEEDLKCDVSINTLSLFPKLNDPALSGFPLVLSEQRATVCCDLVDQGNADVALVACMRDTIPVGRFDLIATAPIFYLCSENSELAKKDSLDIRDFVGHDVLLLPDSSFVYEKLLRQYNSLKEPNSRIREIASQSLMKTEVRAHDAIAIANSEFSIKPPAGLVALASDDPELNWNLFAVFPPNETKQSALELGRVAKGVLTEG